MEIKIYGRDGCPYCVKAKKLAQQAHDWLTEKVKIDYHDTVKERLGKAELSALAGKPVTTVPQVFINGKHVGGFTEMDAFMRDAVTRGTLNFK